MAPYAAAMRRVNPTRRPSAACFSATALLAAEVLAAPLLWRLGDVEGLGVEIHDLRHWLRTADTENLLGSTARLVALILVAWLIATTLASMARRCIPALRGATSLDALTLPAVRQFLDRALVLSIGVSTLVGQSAAGATTVAGRTDLSRAATVTTTALPAGGAHYAVTPKGDFSIRAAADSGPSAAEPADAPTVPRAPTAETPASSDTDTGVQENLVIRAPDGAGAPKPDPGTTPSSATTTTIGTTPTIGERESARRADNLPHSATANYEVEPGDSLWRIAEQQVAGVAPRNSEAAVSHYWALMVEANRTTLRSGDPSLIYPGEIVVLPPLDGALS